MRYAVPAILLIVGVMLANHYAMVTRRTEQLAAANDEANPLMLAAIAACAEDETDEGAPLSTAALDAGGD